MDDISVLQPVDTMVTFYNLGKYTEEKEIVNKISKYSL